MKILSDGKELQYKINGYVLHTVPLTELLIQKIKETKRANLCDESGQLSKRAKNVFTKLFGIYSCDGLMTKDNLNKFMEVCLGIPCGK